MIQCPKCHKELEQPSEQAACIELFGECICCRIFKLNDDEIEKIQKRAYTGEKND